MRLQSQTLIRKWFAKIPARIFMPSELGQMIREHRSEWNAWGTATEEITDFLLEEGFLKEAEFKSKDYDPIFRYLRGEHSATRVGLSLQRDSFLSHRAAMVVHDMVPPSNVLYVNKEQSPKRPPDDVTQEAISRAFTNAQRTSKYIFTYANVKYVLLSGKHTGRAGVITKSVAGEKIDVTDLERTLIDIVVRPAYAGRIQAVADAYMRFADQVKIDHMIKLLQAFHYAYPYHQSIGFLLRRAGRSPEDCRKFAALGKGFDFYLDYGMKHPAYDQEWRLYYPQSLNRSRAPQKS